MSRKNPEAPGETIQSLHVLVGDDFGVVVLDCDGLRAVKSLVDVPDRLFVSGPIEEFLAGAYRN